jgi:DNA-binding NtrC family response regulator
MHQQEIQGRVLVVEDEPMLAQLAVDSLAGTGLVVSTAGSLDEARAWLEASTPDLILLDIGLPDGSGLDFIPELRDMDEFVSIVLLTAHSGIDVVVEAMQRGADNFLAKPVEPSRLVTTIEQTLQRHRTLRSHWATTQRQPGRASTPAEALPRLIGHSEPIMRVRSLAFDVAETDASVMILGETGTGKDIVARGIHEMSSRAAGPFVDINCASIPEQMVESELFGHERGAFTGAATRKPGLLEAASGGTLFLDEIAELGTLAQSKLLKAIESQTFRRLGGLREISVDVRFIVATHRDLATEIAAERFREDLFFRVGVFQLQLPPLRERGDDVLLLARHFLARLNPELRRSIEGISARAERLLQRHDWPGNVRELRNVIEGAMILARGERSLLPRHLPPYLGRPSRQELAARSLDEVEAEHIRRVLELTSENLAKTAKILGISRSTLYEKLKRHGIRE